MVKDLGFEMEWMSRPARACLGEFWCRWVQQRRKRPQVWVVVVWDFMKATRVNERLAIL
jgi:hypothetical protein